MTDSPPSKIAALEPLDSYNQTLASHVHPADWINPTPRPQYDLVVIGGGTAGLVTAAGAAGLGATVALIERELLGGDCLNVGCVPSKALIRSAAAFADIRSVAEFGVNVNGEPTADFSAVMRRLRRLRSGISEHDSAARFRALGVDVFLGSGRFTGRRTIEVNSGILRFRRAVIATGARAAVSPIPGLEAAGFLTNETVFSLTQPPPRLAVIGAGPIGCELSQAFARLGSKVHLLSGGHLFLAAEDRDAADRVEAALVNDGVEIISDQAILRIGPTADGRKVIYFSGPGNISSITVDAILVATGRTPNCQGLNLEAAGVAWDPVKGVLVDDFLRTKNKMIYAAGDVCSAFKFTHAADAMARIVLRNALFFGRDRVSHLIIPHCTYTDPEVAGVGLSESHLKKAGTRFKTIRVDMKSMDRAILEGQTDGFLKVHLAAGKDRILGATLVARHAGEMISELALAMTAGLGLSAVAKTIHPYPTQSEIFKRAGDAFSRTRLTPRAATILQTLIKMRRWI